jgi:hypothetical protein
VTLVEFVGDLGSCMVRVVPENTLPFKPQWYPMSIHGYHQAANVPPEYANHPALSMTGGYALMWNARLPENGAVSLHKDRAERDAYLRGDDDPPA